MFADLVSLPFLVVLGGIFAAGYTRFVWLWCARVFVVVLLYMASTIVWAESTLFNSAMLLPFLVGVVAHRSRRSGLLWGISTVLTTAITPAILVQNSILPAEVLGKFSIYSAIIMFIVCGAMMLYLWWRVHPQQKKWP